MKRSNEESFAGSGIFSPAIMFSVLIIRGLEHPCFTMQLLSESSGSGLCIAVAEKLRLLCLLWEVDLVNPLM
jgi:hypothetical protein